MAKGKKVQGAKPAKKPVAGKARGGKRSKAESMTGAKDAAVEVRQASLQIDTVQLDGSDFDMNLKGMKGAKEKFDTAKRLYDGECKRIKKQSPEMLDACKLALKIDKLDTEDVKRELGIYGFVLKQTEHPVQLVLHDTLLGDVKETHYKRGIADGKAGRTASSGCPEGSDLDAEYQRGWRHGTSENLGLTPEQSDAAIADGEGVDLIEEVDDEPSDPDAQADAVKQLWDKKASEAVSAHGTVGTA